MLLGAAPLLALILASIGPRSAVIVQLATEPEGEDTLLTSSRTLGHITPGRETYTGTIMHGMVTPVIVAQLQCAPDLATAVAVALVAVLRSQRGGPRVPLSTRDPTRVWTMTVETLATDVGAIGVGGHGAPWPAQASCGALGVDNA